MENANYQNTQGHSLPGWAAVVGGIGVGAALMYLFDPERGRGRRARLGDQLSSKARKFSEAAEGRAKDLRNRAQGLMHQAGLASAKRSEQSSPLDQ